MQDNNAPRKRLAEGSLRGPGTLDIKEARAFLERHSVNYVLAQFIDIHGVAKSKAVPVSHLEDILTTGAGFAGGGVFGLGLQPHEGEYIVVGDLSTLTLLPWAPGFARVMGTGTVNGKPHPLDPRNVLAAQVARLAERGWTLNAGMEPEFSLFRRQPDGGFAPMDETDNLQKPAYDYRGIARAAGFIDRLVECLQAVGIDVFQIDHEDANGQYEVNFRYAECLTMADRLTMLKLMAKVLARRHGFEATFMPKPYSNRTGSGGHFNMSMASAETGENAFADPDDPRGCGISKLAYHFIAGVLAHAKAIIAVTCPTVNSYKRLVIEGSMTGFTWAPVFISYGNNNRTHMVRVPMNSPRVESRGVDIAVNPYLGAAMMIGAGLDGIERELDPGDPIDLNMYLQTQEKLDELGVDTLPRTLLEAVEAFAADPLSEQVFGKDLRDSYIELKTAEWWDYHNTVSDWEYDRYLEFF